MTNNKGYLLVEGQGEVAAAQNLIARLSKNVGLFQPWAAPRRWINLQHWNPKRQGVMRAAEFIRTKPDAGALLILRDEDDACPATIAPTMASNLRGLNLPFPTAFVLLRPEYEVLFLPCMAKMGPAGVPDGVKWPESSWEAKRDVKGWISAQLPPGRRYKPTVSQLQMTRCIDFDLLREADVPSFGSLERALRFLAAHSGMRGAVYPPAA
ncbi:hypothetical protein ENSA7_35860 [Enhygromyxa salina]|uniref:DUF4276 family protein n=1 Tax=Enhygromyxa salina TaxID=215803 RepID=A0A2S9YNP4_9BACT|nr:hypothetical protein ENSA7_35860 [Enhygromyxa salina]